MSEPCFFYWWRTFNMIQVYIDNNNNNKNIISPVYHIKTNWNKAWSQFSKVARYLPGLFIASH